MDNLIQWRQYFLNGSTWRPFNVGEAELTNWEFAARYFPLEALSFNTDLLHSDAKDRSLREDGSPSASYGKYLPYSPKYRGSISLAYEPQIFGAHLSYSRISEQYSTVDNLAGSMPEIDSINLSGYAHRSFGDLNATLTLQLNNLQDKRYEIYAHIPQPGFNYKIALRLRYEWDL